MGTSHLLDKACPNGLGYELRGQALALIVGVTALPRSYSSYRLGDQSDGCEDEN